MAQCKDDVDKSKAAVVLFDKQRLLLNQHPKSIGRTIYVDELGAFEDCSHHRARYRSTLIVVDLSVFCIVARRNPRPQAERGLG